MGFSTLLLASAVSSLGGLVFGYELGIISGGLLQLKVEFGLSCIQQEALVSSLLIGALLASLVGGALIDRYGCRKSILLSNLLMTTGSLILLISSYQTLLFGRFTVGFAMCQSSMSCCIFVSEMVTPELTWLLLTEIFPAAVRGRAFAFTSCFNWSAHLLVTFTFLDVFNAIGLSGTFLMYGITSMVAAVFFYFMLPETKGKTLQEIDKELRLNRFHHRVECCDFIRGRNFSSEYQRVVSQLSN
ncbi:solute carrier family 2, facilitated glucose transporter member 10 isoform X3 [Phyllopteryx taeniolatus]|uniref:solute carrier family 2, facilitated glucose transporter member 10 isoform X3 n=1 Tax=Phyllopteryx taeniolatus TaxID=161469 RepID=UPI002AD1FC48|nr:solute carrier family 2, facilitated glucose transporter member 10 isoform X3 [Phyllopteryx taeniolatus]